MDEIKEPKKPLVTFWIVAMVLLMLMNLIAIPIMESASILEVDYGTFMRLTEEGNIDQVEIESNKILFTVREGSDIDSSYIYETGLMEDANLVERLYESGAEFSSEIIEESSPFLTFLLVWVLPIVIFLY